MPKSTSNAPAITVDEILAAIKDLRTDHDALTKIRHHAEFYLKQSVAIAFRKGNLAVFDVNGVPTGGRVERINRKSVTLTDTFSLDERGHYSGGYRVSPSLLRAATPEQEKLWAKHEKAQKESWGKLIGPDEPFVPRR